MKNNSFGHFFMSLAVVLAMVLATVPAARASREYMPMGYYIGRAETIVIGDTGEGRGSKKIVFVREVIKGDAALAGQTITLDSSEGVSSASVMVSNNTKGIAILLRPGWKSATDWPVLEEYEKAEQVEALRILATVCTIGDERERLVAMRGTLASNNQFCAEELFAQLGAMRIAENFDLLTDLYPALTPGDQVKLLDLIEKIGDPRGVPTLLAAIASPNAEVSGTAAGVLSYGFPGAPGVTAAFQAALGREHLTRIAARYLARYAPDTKLNALVQFTPTPWMRAMSLLNSGKKLEGRAALLELLAADGENFRTRLSAASELIGEATAPEKEQIRAALPPLLARHAYLEDYLLAVQVAELLRGLRHPDCMDALLPILRTDSFVYTKAAWAAAMAIRELGGEACVKAVAQIQEQLGSLPPKGLFSPNLIRYPLELLWLGSPKDFEQADKSMHADYRASWNSLAPLQNLAAEGDECSFLIGQLSRRSSLPDEAIEWIFLRLGDLKDRRAIGVLAEYLTGQFHWSMIEKAAAALVSIGGPEVEEKLTRLLRHKDENNVRRHVAEALLRLLGDRSRELSRQMLSEKDFGWKPAAYLALGNAGTMDDLKLLESLANFWTGDREHHYWAMSAFRTARERCNQDVNGPIKPSA